MWAHFLIFVFCVQRKCWFGGVDPCGKQEGGPNRCCLHALLCYLWYGIASPVVDSKYGSAHYIVLLGHTTRHQATTMNTKGNGCGHMSVGQSYHNIAVNSCCGKTFHSLHCCISMLAVIDPGINSKATVIQMHSIVIFQIPFWFTSFHFYSFRLTCNRWRVFREIWWSACLYSSANCCSHSLHYFRHGWWVPGCLFLGCTTVFQGVSYHSVISLLSFPFED